MRQTPELRRRSRASCIPVLCAKGCSVSSSVSLFPYCVTGLAALNGTFHTGNSSSCPSSLPCKTTSVETSKLYVGRGCLPPTLPMPCACPWCQPDSEGPVGTAAGCQPGARARSSVPPYILRALQRMRLRTFPVASSVCTDAGLLLQGIHPSSFGSGSGKGTRGRGFPFSVQLQAWPRLWLEHLLRAELPVSRFLNKPGFSMGLLTSTGPCGLGIHRSMGTALYLHGGGEMSFTKRGSLGVICLTRFFSQSSWEILRSCLHFSGEESEDQRLRLCPVFIATGAERKVTPRFIYPEMCSFF